MEVRRGSTPLPWEPGLLHLVELNSTEVAEAHRHQGLGKLEGGHPAAEAQGRWPGCRLTIDFGVVASGF